MECVSALMAAVTHLAGGGVGLREGWRHMRKEGMVEIGSALQLEGGSKWEIIEWIEGILSTENEAGIGGWRNGGDFLSSGIKGRDGGKEDRISE